MNAEPEVVVLCGGQSSESEVSLRSGRAVAAAATGRQLLRTPDQVQACLAACQACPDRRGAACLHCGCILRFKARLATERCPHPAGSRWPSFFSNL
jgi:hypothetical protein